MESNRLQTHQSLERGLRVIEATAAIGGSASLSEIARKTADFKSPDLRQHFQRFWKIRVYSGQLLH